MSNIDSALKNKNIGNKIKKTSGATKLKIIIVLGVLIYTVVMMVNQQSTMETLLNQEEKLLAQKTELEADKAYYENTLQYMGTDAYIIKEAKDRLGWIMQGETKYVEQNP